MFYFNQEKLNFITWKKFKIILKKNLRDLNSFVDNIWDKIKRTFISNKKKYKIEYFIWKTSNQFL